MKILLTGGGSGGHFYPLIAVAEAIRKKAKQEKILDPELFYMGPSQYDERALFNNNIVYKKTSAGKMRRYFSFLNIIDVFKTAWGVLGAFIEVFSIYPDVVFAKGGYASFPVLLAARFFRIPIIIHESDSVPGRLNLWAGKFADRIAVSYPDAALYFPKDKVAFTGNPIRKEIQMPLSNGAHEFLKLEQDVPVVLILGGSQGAELINDTVLDSLQELLKDFQVIHQTGKRNLQEVKNTSEILLQNSQFKYRYHPIDYLNDLALRMSAGIADVIVSRAGSTIFEISAWGVPSILIPITDSNGDHQRKNAYNYARSGGAIVIEESNISAPILVSEIHRIAGNHEQQAKMRKSAKEFARLDASEKIADVLLEIALEHER